MQSEATKAMNQAGDAPADAPGVAGQTISDAMEAEDGNASQGAIASLCLKRPLTYTISGAAAAQLQSKVTKERNAEAGKFYSF